MTIPVRSERDLVYREIGGHQLQLDLHIPAGVETPPLVAYFHGGGFEVGSRTDYEQTRAIALAERGIAVATVSYRFLSDARFPAPLEDARAAIAWLREHAGDYGISTARIGSMGASAGGYLAAMLGLANADTGLEAAVEVAVPWFPMLDLQQESSGSPLEQRLFPVQPGHGLIDGLYDRADPGHRALNPIANVSAAAADFLLLTGDRDRVMPAAHSQRFHDALVLAGANSTLVTLGGIGHEDPAFDVPEYADFIAGFFRSRLV